VRRPYRTSLLIASVTIASCLAAVPSRATAASQFVLSPEGNNLWAYDAATQQAQLVVEGVNNRDPGTAAPAQSDRRDINAQICVAPDNQHIITGEDTVEPTGNGGDSSHDPRIAGWGYFKINGSHLGDITVHEVGKLAPESGTGPGYTGDPDNFGCGFLDENRLLTTAIGDTLPGDPSNGQLFLWFGPFDNNFRRETTQSGDGFYVGDVTHCAIDSTLATAGGIAIDPANDDVYVASNRFDVNYDAGTIWRYRGAWPTTPDQCTPAWISSHITKTAVLDLLPYPIPFEPIALTPSCVIISPQGTLYVSSVFTGTVHEFKKDGTFIRDIYPLSPLAPRTGPLGNTPFGLAFTDDGALWIADLGIVLTDAAAGQGSVIRQPFDASNNPVLLGATTVKDGLDYPDGLGVWTPTRNS
jgi:hypothetical protein